MTSPWGNPLFYQHTAIKVINIGEAPSDIDNCYWEGDNVFVTHPSLLWHNYTLSEWTELYAHYGLSPRADVHTVLNELLRTMGDYPKNSLTSNLALSLYLGLWCDLPIIYLHSSWQGTDKKLYDFIHSLLTEPQPFTLQWVGCNIPFLPHTFSWHELTP